ncbi:MAG: MgtC/SapB family protein [Gammaproteobacteria bacterium]
MILGGFIGFERELANKPAGFRTHTLVAGAAALFMAVATAAPNYLHASGSVEVDRQPPGSLARRLLHCPAACSEQDTASWSQNQTGAVQCTGICGNRRRWRSRSARRPPVSPLLSRRAHRRGATPARPTTAPRRAARSFPIKRRRQTRA